MPRSHRGRDLVYWMAETGLLDQTVDTLTAPNALVACNPAVSGTEGGHDCNPLTLMARGAVPVGRLEGFRGTRALFADDLAANIAKGIEFEAGLRRQFDEHAGAAPEPALRRRLRSSRTCASSISPVWARSSGRRASGPTTGGSSCPVLDPSGRPLHRRGITDFPGLAFLGVHWLHKRKSSLFIGVGEDAEHVVEQLAV